MRPLLVLPARLPAVLLVLLAVAACGDDAAPPAPAPNPAPIPGAMEMEQPSPRERLPARDGPEPTDLVGGLGDWQPPADALSLARRLSDPATADEARRAFDTMTEDARADVVRAGLRLPDAPAISSAALARWTWLDHAESGRVVALLTPHLFDDDGLVDFEEYRSMLGSREFARVLALFEERQPGEDFAWMLGPLHRSIREEHIPALAQLVGSESPRLSDEAWSALSNALEYTNAHSSAVAAAVAARLGPGRAPSSATLPRELLAMLDVLIRPGVVEDRFNNGFLHYALRWLMRSEIGPGDRPFLIELQQRATAIGDSAALAADAIGRALGEPPGGDGPWFRWRDGDAESARELKEKLTTTPTDELAEFVAEIEFDRHLYRLPWGPALYTAAFPKAPSPPLDGLRLAILGAVVPEYRTHRVARSVYDWLGVSRNVIPLARTCERTPAVLAFLEVADRDSEHVSEFVEVLHEATASEDRDTRRAATRLLVLLRAEWCGPELPKMLAEDDGSDGPFELPDLANGWDPAFGVWARARLETDPDNPRYLATAAAATGLPPASASDLVRRVAPGASEGARPDRETSTAIRALLRRGGGSAVKEAVLAFLDAVPHDHLTGIGALPTNREAMHALREPVIAHLRRMLTRRGSGDRLGVLNELARLGDADAVAELEAAAHEGRYRWIDNSSAHGMAAGHHQDLAFWTGELASNCCRFVAANGVFEDLYGIDLRQVTVSGGIATTPREWIEEWLGRVGGHTEWSEALEVYVPEVR